MSRKLFIKSEPVGAAVIIDGHRVGNTPWEGDFGSYGTRRIELEHPGYATRIEQLTLEMPWWQWPLLDIFTDLLWPGTIQDHHAVDWALTPIDPEAGTWDDAFTALERMRNPPPPPAQERP